MDRSDLPFVRGAVLGALAWLAGYLVTYLVTSGPIRDSALRRFVEFFGGEVPVWKVVGWVFFNAHFVDTIAEGPFGGAGSFIGGEDGFTTLLYLVPVLTLVAAGLVVARGTTDPAAAAQAGLTVAIGYFPLSAAGAFLFVVGADNPVRPDLVTALLLAGVVYPVVLGAMGGLLSTLVSSDSDASPTL
jgi:hypothetical protein